MIAGMISEEEARDRILARIAPLAVNPVPLEQALGRFAAAGEHAVYPLPGFDNSAMDGYAVAAASAGQPIPAGTSFEVCGEQPAGADRGLRLETGQAIRIFTGAPVPGGTQAVVMQEDVQRSGNQIVLSESVEPGEHIRRAGEDLTRGQKLFEAGAKLTPQRLGLLASQGIREVRSAEIPQIAILATGDELRQAGETLGPGEIYESNRWMLASLAGLAGAKAKVMNPARDDRTDLDAKLAEGLHGSDMLVIAGGVSVGERDLVKERLTANGVELDLWRVRVQPGKPFLYGRHEGDKEGHATQVFGLPGNPVSAFVTFLLFVRPAILKMMGARGDDLKLPTFPAQTLDPLSNRGKRPHYVRGTLDPNGDFRLSGKQASHAVFGLSHSNALVRVAPGASVPAGSWIPAMLWSL